jgi:hypothetical protein
MARAAVLFLSFSKLISPTREAKRSSLLTRRRRLHNPRLAAFAVLHFALLDHLQSLSPLLLLLLHHLIAPTASPSHLVARQYGKALATLSPREQNATIFVLYGAIFCAVVGIAVEL